MTRIQTNGVHLNVEVAGDGQPLVLLHGFMGSSATWKRFLPSLSARHRVIAVDLLGHGRSDKPADPAAYGAGATIADLKMLLEVLEVDRFDLLGYSMGGRAALRLALDEPERVRVLILESTSPGIKDEQERARRRERDEELAQRLETEGIERFVDLWERQPLFASQASLPGTVRCELRRQRLANEPAALAASLRGFGAGSVEPVWDQMRGLGQTHLVVGASDAAYREIAESMAAEIPDAAVVVVPNAGHAVHLEQPERFEELILEILDGGPAWE